MATRRPPNGPQDPHQPHDPRRPYTPPRLQPGQPHQQPPPWQPPPGAPPPGAPPRLPRKGRSRTTMIVLSILGVCGLLFVGCIALVVADAPDPDSSTGGGVAPTERPTATDGTSEPKTAKPGEKARDGQFEFTVGRISQHQVWGPEFSRVRAQGIFWAIQVTVANVGDEPRTFEAGWQVAYDAQGRRYEASTAAMTADQDTSFLANINPGNAVKGRVVFDVPKGTRLARVELHDSAFSGGVEVRL